MDAKILNYGRNHIRCRCEFDGEDCFVHRLVQHETEDPASKRAKQKWEKRLWGGTSFYS